MDFWIYLLAMAGVTYLIRALPFALVTRRLKNRFLRSFLYYIPYAVLSVMTFPGALYATGHVWSALIGLFVAVLVALKVGDLTVVASLSCLAVFLSELVLF